MTESLDDLRARLERLERQNLRMKAGGLFALTVLSVLLISGAEPREVPNSLDARRFRVLDRDGKVRVLVGVDDDGSTGFHLMNRQGVERLRMVSSSKDEHTSLAILNAKENEALNLIFDSKGTGAILVRDPSDALRIVLGTAPDGTAALGLADRSNERLTIGADTEGLASVKLRGSGNEAIGLTMNPDGRGVLYLRADDPLSRTGISMTKDGLSLLEMRRKNGDQSAVLFSNSDGRVGFNLGEKHGRIGMFLSPKEPPVLNIFDPGDKHRVRVGIRYSGAAGMTVVDRAGNWIGDAP
jgi:hypothetical protein